MVLRRLVWLAMVIALLVGSLQWVVFQWQALPIIMAAEQLESSRASLAASDDVRGHTGAGAGHNEKPGTSIERHAWTWVASVLLAFGLTLMMLAAIAFWGEQFGARTSPIKTGLLLAGAAFFSLYAWPALGLPPEIPGMDAPRLGSRQVWWLIAACSALSACAVCALTRKPWRWVVALALLVIPFAVGTPHLTGDPFGGFDAEAAMTMRGLASQFVWASVAANLVTWVALGVSCVLAARRWLLPLLEASPSVPR